MDRGIRIMVNGEYIAEFYKWYTEGKLVVNRRYQRKLVWTLEEKRQFIDTLLEGFPVPLFLLVNSEESISTMNNSKMEIIDGLQRLEAIISFILNKYSVIIDGKEQYFNLDAYPGNAILLREHKLQQKSPVMDFEVCHKFLLYQLPVSIINANETIVDDVFKRINSTGRKLSRQDLRQAGVVGQFSKLVHTIATHLRGDATEDVVNMQEIADYSISSAGLDYGLNVKSIFWIEHGIINEDGLRRSKDEEIIAILCSCILSNYTAGMSLSALNRLYNVNSSVYKRNEELLTQDRFDDIVSLFSKTLADFEKIFASRDTTFKDFVFKSEKCYNKDLVFIVLFLSLVQLRTENYVITDYETVAESIQFLADKELIEIISKSDCEWNSEIRNHLIERVKHILVKHMEFREHNPEWNNKFITFLKQVLCEDQMHDFKIGIHDLRDGKENEDVIPKCIKTLIAMSNTKPHKEGVVILGISDKKSDAIDFENHYGCKVPKLNELYISGVQCEAIKYYGSLQNFTRYIKETIEKQNVDPEVIQYLLSNMDVLNYNGQPLIVLKLKSDKPLFYNEELYVRYESHNKAIRNGSEEFYAVFDGFRAQVQQESVTNENYSIGSIRSF